MQSNKTSKKSAKQAPEVSATAAVTASGEPVTKPRATRSSKSKSESAEVTPVKRHRKVVASAVETPAEAEVSSRVTPEDQETPALSASVAEEPALHSTSSQNFPTRAAEIEASAHSTEATAHSTFAKHPSREEIAKLAHELFLRRGGQHGFAEQDWLQAESQLKMTAAGA